MQSPNTLSDHYVVPELPQPDVHSATLGRLAVDELNKLARHQVEAGKYQDQTEHRQHLIDTKKNPSHHGALGRKIGQMRGQMMTSHEALQVAGIGTSEYYHQYHTATAEATSNRLDNELEVVREKLVGLSEAQSKKLDEYMEREAPGFLMDVKNIPSGRLASLPWAQYLAENKPVEGKKYKGEHEGPLTNFLQWHVDAMERQKADPVYIKTLEKEQQAYMRDVKQGVDDGWLSELSIGAIAEDVTEVFPGDIFDTILEERGGYHDVDTGNIVLAVWDGQDKDARELAELFYYHEKDHALLQQRDGLIVFDMEWLSEALTEHVAVALKYGSPEAVHPNKRHEPAKGRIFDRILLNTLLNEGDRPVLAALATKAYSGSIAEQKTFSDALDEVWEDDILLKATLTTAGLQKKLDSYPELLLSISEKLGLSQPLPAKDLALYMTSLMLVESRDSFKEAIQL